MAVYAYQNGGQTDPQRPWLDGYDHSRKLALSGHYTNRLRQRVLLIQDALKDIGLLEKNNDAETGSQDARKQLEFHSVHQGFAKALIAAALNENFAIWDSERLGWYFSDNERLSTFRRSSFDGPIIRGRRHRLRNGDLIAYSIRTFNPTRTESRPFDATLVSSIVGILFAKEAKLDGDLIILSNSISLRIVDHGQKLGPRNQSPAEVVFELREVLHRFIALAFADMCDIRDIPEDDEARDEKVASCNTMFKGEHQLREAMTQGLLKVLEADEEDRINAQILVDGKATSRPQSGGNGDDDAVEDGDDPEGGSYGSFWQTLHNEDGAVWPL